MASTTAGTKKDEGWERQARELLEPKMASSAYVITLNPTSIDPKVALETGYAILLGKPILLVVSPGEVANEGLRRIADKVVDLRSPLDTDAGRFQLMAEMAAWKPDLAARMAEASRA